MMRIGNSLGLRVIPISPTLRVFPMTHATMLAHNRLFSWYGVNVTADAPSSSNPAVLRKLDRFPKGLSDFREIRESPRLARFDKTSYIPAIADGTAVQLFCRPKRFRKSLTISMLRYFHGVEFRNQYDQLFKVCGREMLFTYNLCGHTYARNRVSTWTELLKTVKLCLDSILF